MYLPDSAQHTTLFLVALYKLSYLLQHICCYPRCVHRQDSGSLLAQTLYLPRYTPCVAAVLRLELAGEELGLACEAAKLP